MSSRLVINGMTAVLYSPGYGAGWSTWANTEYRNNMLFDPWIADVLLSVEYGREEKLERIAAYCVVRYPGQYLGGLQDLSVELIPQGTLFRITEYDGAETVELKESDDWIMA